MKFVIYREIDGKRKTLAEWDQDKIFEILKKHYDEAWLKTWERESVLNYAWEKTIKEFKKESIKIA